jgi:hypothetical protein
MLENNINYILNFTTNILNYWVEMILYIYIYIYMKFHAVIKCLGIRANDEDEGMTQSQVLLYVIYHIYFAG